MSFEENVEQLEKIVQELEKGDLNLDESIKKFEEGIGWEKNNGFNKERWWIAGGKFDLKRLR